MTTKFKVIAVIAIATTTLVFANFIATANKEIYVKDEYTVRGNVPTRIVEINIEYNQDTEDILEETYGAEIDEEIDEELGDYLLAVDTETGPMDFIIHKVDTTPPQLPKIEDIILSFGATYDGKEKVATINDDLDGTLEVEYEGDVDTSKPGKYPVTYYVEDDSGNVSEEEYIVTVKEKVVARPAAAPTTSTGSSRANNTIYLERQQRLVYYSNGSSDVNVVQSALDSSPGVAKIYSIVGGNYHSGSDWVTTYFTGHEYSAFSNVAQLTYGDVITVKTNDTISTYAVSEIFTVTATINESGTRTVAQSYIDKINSVAYSESIILQTCIQGAPTEILVVIATLK